MSDREKVNEVKEGEELNERNLLYKPSSLFANTEMGD